MIDPRRILSCISEIRGTISSPRYYSFLISGNFLNVLLKVRLRVFDDLTNKTAEQAVELPRTVKFLRDHLDVTEINDDCLLVLYNFVFTHLKYMNKKVDMETFNQNEKKNAKYAREQPWAYVMERVESDRQSKKDYTVVKERISAFMRAGHVFEPL